MMSPGVAPTAMRIPISRVRSVTLTNMMFMIPMPPTSSATPTIASTTHVAMPVMLATLESSSDCVYSC